MATAALFALLFILLAAVAAAYLTNPFSKLSIIRQPYKVRQAGKSFKVINDNHKLTVHQGVFWRWLAIIKCGIYIVTTRYVHSTGSQSDTVEDIITDIHRHRFNPNRLLVVSGDHFTSLFVRNLGVFYYPLLDACLESSRQDWHDRQTVYLQTVAYALGVFAKHPVPTTTIVPGGAYRATCVNFYAYPSDTVYGILYALAVLSSKQAPYAGQAYAKPRHQLATVDASKQLLRDYRPTLLKLYRHYRSFAYDEQTGLISRRVHMSGAKDITRRQSAFYDNVVFWKTTELAMTLGVIDKNQHFLDELKRRILATFWIKDKGYFLEDLSDEGRAQAYYSSDWLIVLATGFLYPTRRGDRRYFAQSIAYIQRQGVDRPFAIKYQHETRAARQFLPVRLAVASYGGDAIWSFWGMEYIKALLLMHRATGTSAYLKEADYHIAAYQRTMLRDRGFPEVYDPQGRLLQTPLYRSIRQTGWVVGFEQVLAMRQATGRTTEEAYHVK